MYCCKMQLDIKCAAGLAGPPSPFGAISSRSNKTALNPVPFPTFCLRAKSHKRVSSFLPHKDSSFDHKYIKLTFISNYFLTKAGIMLRYTKTVWYSGFFTFNFEFLSLDSNRLKCTRHNSIGLNPIKIDSNQLDST